jgi:parvulin-like peptidyl-prolyl isomerase
MPCAKHFDGITPKEGPGYRIRQIIVADENRAKEVKQALDGGADFADIASSATNVDVLTKSRGGMRDFTPQGILPKEFDDAVANLQLGQVSEPFKSNNRYAIVQLMERAEAKEYTDQERSAVVSKAVEDWLQTQREELSARSFMDKADRKDFVLEHSGALDIARQRASSQRPASGGSLPIVPSGGSR